MLNFIIENFGIIFALIVCAIAGGACVYGFFKLPSSKQMDKVKEWLFWAVAEAEKSLGSGTGQLKLRYVYNLFIDKYGFMARVISFEKFSSLVDESLDKFKKVIETNQSVKDYIGAE